jgi:hypothetical protein
VSDELILDDEVLYRRIPPGDRWFKPPNRISSANFKLRKMEDDTKEEGLSVYRAAVVSPAEVLTKPDAIAASRVASARAGEIRGLRNGAGKPLHLELLAVDDENDPGHAEIRGPKPRQLSGSASEALRRAFQLVDD